MATEFNYAASIPGDFSVPASFIGRKIGIKTKFPMQSDRGVAFISLEGELIDDIFGALYIKESRSGDMILFPKANIQDVVLTSDIKPVNLVMPNFRGQ